MIVNQSKGSSCGDKCCPVKVVDGVHYTFKHEDSKAISHYHCLNGCVYTKDSDPSKEYCFEKGKHKPECINCKLPGKHRCTISRH